MTNQINKIRKHYKGCYRITLTGSLFGQVKKDGSTWNAEIRSIESGNIERYAGIWNTRKEAVEEVKRLAR